VVMPPVLKLNRPVIEERIGHLADYLGIKGGFDGFYDYVLKLRADLGVPDKLAELGVSGDRIDEMAEMALKDPSCAGNPIELTKENVVQLFNDCI